jgi:hypothetical protein
MAKLTTRTKVPYTITVDGPIENLVGASSDETVGRVVPDDATGLTGFVEGVAPSQVDADGVQIPNRVTWTGDAKIGPGENNLLAISEDFTCDMDPRDEATTMTVTFGTPVDK